MRDNSVYEVVEQRPLSAQAVAGVTFDAVVRLGFGTARRRVNPTICCVDLPIPTTPHDKRGK